MGNIDRSFSSTISDDKIHARNVTVQLVFSKLQLSLKRGLILEYISHMENYEAEMPVASVTKRVHTEYLYDFSHSPQNTCFLFASLQDIRIRYSQNFAWEFSIWIISAVKTSFTTKICTFFFTLVLCFGLNRDCA